MMKLWVLEAENVNSSQPDNWEKDKHMVVQTRAIGVVTILFNIRIMEYSVFDCLRRASQLLLLHLVVVVVPSRIRTSIGTH